MQKKNERTGKRILLWLLAAVMTLTVQGISVLAETAGETVDVAETAEQTGEIRELPTNPVHHCMEQDNDTDTTTWSYVYFGSYPQTEIKGDSLTAEIIGASYDANGDAWANGIKYRRIRKSDTNNDEYFGDSEYRYFKWEKIKWRVLQNNGSTLFVVSDKGLDCKEYHEENASVTWENCTLRSWLNNSNGFYDTAFSSSEQGAIVSQTVVNEDNPYYNTEGGNDTTDKIYLLSLSEGMNLSYGFCEYYIMSSASRWMQASDYAHAMGVYTYSNSSTGDNANCYWWLRSPSNTASTAASVSYNGYVGQSGNSVHDNTRACVPVLHINLSSDLWSMADDGTNGEGTSGGIGDGNGRDPGNNNNFGVHSGSEITQVAPKATTLKGKLKVGSKSIIVQWKKQTGITGYQIQYSSSKKFTKKTTKIKTVKKFSKTSITVKKLKSYERYYVRIRTYRIVSGKTYYSDWSKTKSVKTKK